MTILPDLEDHRNGQQVRLFFTCVVVVAALTIRKTLARDAGPSPPTSATTPTLEDIKMESVDPVSDADMAGEASAREENLSFQEETPEVVQSRPAIVVAASVQGEDVDIALNFNVRVGSCLTCWYSVDVLKMKVEK